LACREAARATQYRSNLHQFGLYIEQRMMAANDVMPRIDIKNELNLRCPTIPDIDKKFENLLPYSQTTLSPIRRMELLEYHELPSSEIGTFWEISQGHGDFYFVVFLDGHVESVPTLKWP
jgi:hypothetical protein